MSFEKKIHFLIAWFLVWSWNWFANQLAFTAFFEQQKKSYLFIQGQNGFWPRNIKMHDWVITLIDVKCMHRVFHVKVWWTTVATIWLCRQSQDSTVVKFCTTLYCDWLSCLVSAKEVTKWLQIKPISKQVFTLIMAFLNF